MLQLQNTFFLCKFPLHLVSKSNATKFNKLRLILNLQQAFYCIQMSARTIVTHLRKYYLEIGAMKGARIA